MVADFFSFYVPSWIEMLSRKITEHNIPPEFIYNEDEVGFELNDAAGVTLCRKGSFSFSFSFFFSDSFTLFFPFLSLSPFLSCVVSLTPINRENHFLLTFFLRLGVDLNQVASW